MSDKKVPKGWEIYERESDGVWFAEHRDGGGPINSRQSHSTREGLMVKIEAWEAGQPVSASEG